MLDTLGNSDSDSYLAQMTQFGDSTFESLLAPDFAEKVNRNLPSEWFGGLYRDADPNAPAAAAMFADLESYLPGDILTKVDIASMSIALECRSPFLDRDVVDFACSLPTEWRLRGFANHKYILKRAFADLLPQEIVNRRKTGFAVPLPEWFRGPLRGLLYSVLLDPSARSHEFVNGATVRVLVEEHTSGQKNHASSLWTLLMLEMWFKTWSGR
jgi:asparagine synthase (glutamine-hydrolysing)